jgi:tRNA uridine 5-carboxymethylaminomethyl modification enzyme
MFHVEHTAVDVVVVGAGHAGIEASLAAARMGCSTLLVTMDRRATGRMSCNPAIGGTAKGHLVREIDALGGEMGKLADATGIHFRILNRSKGPAVWSPRSQNDREWYNREASARIETQPGLRLVEDSLADVIVKGGELVGVRLAGGNTVRCRTLVLCSGTFLNGVMHTGETTTTGGRYGEGASTGVTERLKTLGFVAGRLKTGTPPRLSLRTIDLSSTEMQEADPVPQPFSFQTGKITNRQIPMYLTYTNPRTHEILRLGFSRSPMFTGRIQGVGPRYCPSIEDKINRFAGRDRHHLFLEPEGYETDVVYVNGFSTSLPLDIQQRAIETVPGLEKALIIRPGYAVEYDYFPPHQVRHTLETKLVCGLFFAGQINGTSGYEEAAAQGMIAGINAALKVRGEDPFVLGRDEAYIGVLIDDLINKGTEEPYRMFTSCAEYRLLLRQDNADTRLMRKGHRLGLIPLESIERLDRKEERVRLGKQMLRQVRVNEAQAEQLLAGGVSGIAGGSTSLEQLLRRPEVSIADLLRLPLVDIHEHLSALRGDPESSQQVEIETKYEGYLRRQEEQVQLFGKNEGVSIPEAFDYHAIRSLSAEGREKLQHVRPRSLGQASRISGVTPADVAVLMITLVR